MKQFNNNQEKYSLFNFCKTGYKRFIIVTVVTALITLLVILTASKSIFSPGKNSVVLESPTPTSVEPSGVLEEYKTEQISTPASKAQNKVENKPIPTLIPFPTLAPQTASNTYPTSNTQPKTYSIVPISVMNIGAMEPHLQIIAQNAYQEFLRTSNLNRLDELNQIEILVGIYAHMLRDEITDAQQNLSQLKQENTTTLTPTPVTIYINSEVEAKLAELRQTLDHIYNQPVAMSVIYGKMQREYQDWAKNNPEIYAAILGSRYINDLNAILVAYGLY